MQGHFYFINTFIVGVTAIIVITAFIAPDIFDEAFNQWLVVF